MAAVRFRKLWKKKGSLSHIKSIANKFISEGLLDKIWFDNLIFKSWKVPARGDIVQNAMRVKDDEIIRHLGHKAIN